MTIAEWCVFGTLLLSLLTIVSVKWAGIRGFDNSKPRDPDFYDDPIRSRALGAHQNGLEASRSSPLPCCSPNSASARCG